MPDRARIAQLLYDRYRADPPAPGRPDPALWSETLDVLLSHRSVRAYTNAPLVEGTLETLIAAAQSASSSSNLQAWSVVAVQDPDHKARLAALAGNQRHIVDAPLFLVWLIDLNRLAQLARARNQPSEALDYVECLILGAVDTSLAAQNAVVALESLGLGAVYIGAVRNQPAQIAAELGLPPHVFALFGLCVGHPDPAKPAHVKPRLPAEAVLFHERYVDAEVQQRAVTSYDQRLRIFQKEEGLPVQDWTGQAADRIRDRQALHGRDALRAALHDQGFPLK